jgi:hypothetical protein
MLLWMLSRIFSIAIHPARYLWLSKPSVTFFLSRRKRCLRS